MWVFFWYINPSSHLMMLDDGQLKWISIKIYNKTFDEGVE
ncbi:hypothetical protein CLH_2515 [Clostridium botulinum E3 str. Alaska E43]|nr:hypothetical protein CLH_2515 [Clostridium botulinum E3 str. Alaska E43]